MVLRWGALPVAGDWSCWGGTHTVKRQQRVKKGRDPLQVVEADRHVVVLLFDADRVSKDDLVSPHACLYAVVDSCPLQTRKCPLRALHGSSVCSLHVHSTDQLLAPYCSHAQSSLIS